MNKLKKIKAILSMLILIASMIFIIQPVLNAVSIGTRRSFDSFTYGLLNSREFYCKDYGRSMYGGTWEAVSNVEYRSDSKNHNDRIRAYILYKGKESGQGGYNNYSKYQIALWMSYGANVTASHVGSQAKVNEGRNLYNEAYNATKNPISFSGGSSTIIKSNSKNIKINGNVGTIKLSSVTGTITNMVVKLEEIGTKKVISKTINSGSNQVKDWIAIYSNQECTKPININNIKTNKVYIKNLNNNYLIKSVTINAKNDSSKGFKVNATIWSNRGNVRGRHPSLMQQLISVDAIQQGQPSTGSLNMEIEYAKGNILIKKIGVYNENGEKKTDKNVSASFKLYCNTLKKWVSGNATGNKTYVNTIDKATEYRSNTTVKNLLPTYKYELVEVKVNNPEYNPIKMIGATSNLQKGLTIGKNGEYYSAQGIIVYANNPNEVTVEDEKATGNLKILKVDDKYKDIVLSGAEFIIKKEGTENWIIQNSDGTYNYNGKYEDIVNNKIGVYTTNAQGIAEINKLQFDTYHIYEIKAPDGYNIEKQDNYDKDKKWVDLGTVALGGKDTNVTYTVTNKKIVRLEGRVWQDISADKVKLVADNVYTEDTDKLLAGIEVSLYNSDNKVIATTTTDNQGYYKFENLNYWDLAGCYVGFTYDNTNYVAIDPFVEKDLKINSKAIEENMTVEELDDSKLTGTKGDFPGMAITYKGGNKLTPKQILDNNKAQDKDLNTTPLTGYYNEETYTIEDINLGLLEKAPQFMYVGENLEYIKISLNGYTYTYNYGEKEIMNAQLDPTFVPTVTKQTDDYKFYAKLYPTDVAYNSENKSEDLKVYAVYSIGVKNNTTTHEDDIYNEKKLYLKELNATYDKDRFVFSKDQIGNEQENKEFNLWDEKDGKLTFNVYDKDSVFAKGINELETKTTHIQFRVKNDIVNKILTDPDSIKNNIEATKASATGYHEYLRTDNVWVDNKDVKAFSGVKGTYEEKVNGDGDKYYVHKSKEETRTSAGLYLTFQLGKDRILSGTVFEDDVVKPNESTLGNGILEESEKNRAQNVKVELLDENYNVVNLYQQTINEQGKTVVKKLENNELPKAVTTTNSDGTYTFEGVVPGYYFIRFTYSEKDENGVIKQVMKTTDGNKLISSQDFRSTIINTEKNNSIIKTAMENKNNIVNDAKAVLIKYYKNESIDPKIDKMTAEDAKKVLEWYKYLNNVQYSTAVDKITGADGRTSLNENEYTQNTALKDNAIPAYTPIIGISLENNNADARQIPADQQLNEQKEETAEDKLARTFDTFNFGLIEQIIPNITTDKKLTNVKFTNQAGTTLVSENPANRKSTYVTALDAITGGSKYAKLEIEPELIYGSNVELTYEISIVNNSVEDFVENADEEEFGDYFKYGESQKAKAKKITVKVVEDDLDIKFNEASLPTETVQTKYSKEGTVMPVEHNITINKTESDPTTDTNQDGETITTKTFEMKGWESLESGESSKTSYTVTALIANDDLDSEYKNDAKIKSLSLDELTTLTTKSQKIWEAKTATFTITPTTGENRNYIYWYVGAAALVIVAFGIVLIKKKVL